MFSLTRGAQPFHGPLPRPLLLLEQDQQLGLAPSSWTCIVRSSLPPLGRECEDAEQGPAGVSVECVEVVFARRPLQLRYPRSSAASRTALTCAHTSGPGHGAGLEVAVLALAHTETPGDLAEGEASHVTESSWRKAE